MTLQNDFFRDLALAHSLLTRLPIKLNDQAYARTANAAWAYPLVGLFTGLVSCAVVALTLWFGLPIWCAAISAIAASVIVTGAMHEDGLADCADGFWGGWDPAMRLKIMKDSQIGTYGMIALVTSLALRSGAMLEILVWENWAFPLIAIAIASRAVMPILMTTLPHARDTGLSRSVGKIALSTALIALAIGGAALLLAFGMWAIGLAIIALISVSGFAVLARQKIGGQTGDVCGGAQQITEITLLLVLIAG